MSDEILLATDFLFISGGGVPGEFEIFQGKTLAGSTAAAALLSGDGSSSSPISISIASDDAEIDPAAWAAQTDMISTQSLYLDEVTSTFNARMAHIPKQPSLAETILTTLLEWGSGKVATYFWGPVAGEVAELVVSVAGECISLLKEIYTQGASLCSAMKAENAALLTWDATTANYDRRSRILTQHDESIQNLLMQAASAEAVIMEPKEDLTDSWKDWIEDVVENIGDIDDWFDTANTQANSNLPVPVPPSLPKIPDKTTDVKSVLLYYLVKYGQKALMELIKKWFEKQPEDKITADDLLQALQDLKFNDEELRIPSSNLRIIGHGKAIVYGGE